MVKLKSIKKLFSSSKPASSHTATFSELPTEVVDEVLRKLGPIDRIIARKVSRKFRAIIEATCRFKEIKIEIASFYNPTVSFRLDDACITYETVGQSCIVSFGKKRKKVKKRNCVDVMLDDLSSLLRNPKLNLEVFKLQFYIFVEANHRETLVNSLPVVLKSAEPLNVSEFQVKRARFDEMVPILACFEAGKLRKLSFLQSIDQYDLFETIVHLDQWKEAKVLEALFSTYLIDVEELFHFEHFKIKTDSFTTEDAIQIRDILTVSAHFQYAKLFFPENRSTELTRVFDPKYEGPLSGSINYQACDANFIIDFSPHHFEIKKIFHT